MNKNKQLHLTLLKLVIKSLSRKQIIVQLNLFISKYIILVNKHKIGTIVKHVYRIFLIIPNRYNYNL